MTVDQSAERAPPAPVKLPARVLVVDDDPTLLRVLAEVLRTRLEGVAIEACESSVKALGKIAETDYDVVVSDLFMRGLDGFELLQRVRVIRPSSLVLFITGAEDRDLSVRALRGGAYDFIKKPVDAEYLLASVRRAIETRRLRAEIERQQAVISRRAEELEQTVEERTQELRRANHAKDEFLATLSHELRTPLTAILGWARLLSSGRLDASMSAQALESIGRNARSQAELIDDMLDVSRIITGKLRLDIKPVDLLALLDAALGVVLPAAQAKNIDVDADVESGLDSMLGDPERLQQVLWNLLSNAIKFTPAGGRVVIRIRRAATGLEIEVEDNGSGIEPSLLPYVFDRFRQGDTQLSAHRGLGLGLAIARHIVELHGGTIVASSDGQGKGARFTITLPGAAREARGAERTSRPRFNTLSRIAAGPSSQCLRATRVLVVDDEPDTRQVVCLMLEHAGAVVAPASSLSEAREAFARERPDVILCDIGLGADDGCTLMREIRALPPEAGGNIPAIALTAFARPEDRERTLAAGFQIHLAKPGPADLANVVAGVRDHGGA